MIRTLLFSSVNHGPASLDIRRLFCFAHTAQVDIDDPIPVVDVMETRRVPDRNSGVVEHVVQSTCATYHFSNDTLDGRIATDIKVCGHRLAAVVTYFGGCFYNLIELPVGQAHGATQAGELSTECPTDSGCATGCDGARALEYAQRSVAPSSVVADRDGKIFHFKLHRISALFRRATRPGPETSAAMCLVMTPLEQRRDGRPRKDHQITCQRLEPACH